MNSRPDQPARSLREGFTTGTAAAAAAKTAVLALLGQPNPTKVDVPLPLAGRLMIPVDQVALEPGSATAWVVKDGGDDPDATHGARIGCQAEIVPGGENQAVYLEGGQGVGRVTRPGLGLTLGQAAINPAPREQISRAAREAMAEANFQGSPRLTIMVENGQALAAKTLNPRLGIIGGISILGTTGIVKPFSHEAWRATIASGLAVARAMDCPLAALTTGRKSERLLMALRPDLPPWAFIQAADYFAWSLKQASHMGFEDILWGCFFGKLAKMAQGLEYTHARTAPSDMAALAKLAAQSGAGPTCQAEVARANTARQALELIGPPVRQVFAANTAKQALAWARHFTGPGPRLEIVCFDHSGEILARVAGET